MKSRKFLLVGFMAIFIVLLQIQVSAAKIDMISNSRVTPPLAMRDTVTVGDTVYIQIPPNNFEWVDDIGLPVEADGQQFTEEMIEEAGIEIHGWDTAHESALYFAKPKLVIHEGGLYIAVFAKAPTQGSGVTLPLGVRCRVNARLGPVCTGVFTVVADITPPGGDGNGDGEGGSNGDGDNNNSDGDGNGEDGNSDKDKDDGGGGDTDEKPGAGDGGDGSGSGGGPGGGDEGSGKPEPEYNVIAGLNPSFSLSPSIEAAQWSVRAGDSIWIPLESGALLWADSSGTLGQPTAGRLPSLSELRQAGIEVGFSRVAQSDEVIANVSLLEQAGEVGILLQVQERIITWQDVEFSGVLTITDGTATLEGEINGTLLVTVTYAGPGDSYLSIENMAVVEPTADLTAVELYIGEGVTLTANLKQGRRYAGVAVRNAGSGGIESVCALYLLGFDNSTKVHIADNAVRYVYDAEGAYLGRTGEQLVLQDTYYIRNVAPMEYTSKSGGGAKRSDSPGRNTANVIIPTPAALYHEEQGSGQTPVPYGLETEVDDTYSTNINENPSTGA